MGLLLQARQPSSSDPIGTFDNFPNGTRGLAVSMLPEFHLTLFSYFSLNLFR